MSSQPASKLSRLPAIDRLLNATEAENLIAVYGRSETRRVARNTLESMRNRIGNGEHLDTSMPTICASVQAELEASQIIGPRRVFNLSGTLLHTNLGRALLPRNCIEAVVEVMREASDLEYDLKSGRRDNRDRHLEQIICDLTGAEAATVVNNNAAAVMLVLNTLALGKEVPVSRGELVEIGGSFRIPDIMARSGCHLVEVGTTNRTHAEDFASAINSGTALVMKVHQSNFVIHGFTASVEDRELSKLCANHSIPFVVDLGSGALVNLEDYGLAHEPTVAELLSRGADLVTFSGDKLLGGPQAGIIAGRRDLIIQLNANPMKRALRCDKMTIAALSALLRLYRHPERLSERLPILKLMTRGKEAIRSNATAIAETLQKRIGNVAEVAVIECDSEIGSGALPDRLLPSLGVAITPRNGRLLDEHLSSIASAFRHLPIPVIGRINKGRFILDCRTLEDSTTFVDHLHLLDIDL